MKTIQELTLNYKAKNEERKLFEFWKPRYLDKEVTIYNAEITIGDEEISNDGTVSYTITADTKHIAKSFAEKM